MSPTIFRKAGYRYYFFSRKERRMHVQVSHADGEAKFWLEPRIELEKNAHFSPVQLKRIEHSIRRHRNEIAKAWQRYFSG